MPSSLREIVVQKTKELVQCPSVTPLEEGTLDLLEKWLKPLGFICERMPFHEQGYESVDNLYARLGTSAPHFCFAGHTDVVPVGSSEGWTHPPFSAHIDEEGRLHGRGTSDMKGAITAFVTALQAFLFLKPTFKGSISLMITGDEEGIAVNGTKKMVRAFQAREETFDACIVGEPTNPETMGTMIKIGRRGSVNAVLTVQGKQGHVAYPHLSCNPIPQLVSLLTALKEPLDNGNPAFQASNLEITDLQVGNTATNIIPEKASARFNVRFNSEWSSDTLIAEIKRRLDSVAQAEGITYTLTPTVSGESFLTDTSSLTPFLVQAIEEISGTTAELSTTGGTSDARFIKDLCPVIEYGLIGKTIHQVNEHTTVEALDTLSQTYLRFLQLYFKE